MFRRISILPNATRRLVSAGIVALLSALVVIPTIYRFENYGAAIFLFAPFFMGFGSGLMYSFGNEVRRVDSIGTGFLSLTFFAGILFLFAFEGIICILMAAPIGAGISIVGSVFAHDIFGGYRPGYGPGFWSSLIAIPLVAWLEQGATPRVHEVSTSIVIDAPAEIVWRNVVAFPELDAPTELLFRAGISYPTDAKIEGSGVGAVRYCNFNAGTFVEPITIWAPPQTLAFDVQSQATPMKELSMWDVDAPHLHDFFQSKRGRFDLIPTPDGKICLTGTTWYAHGIKPEIYWRLWSDHIVHSIHERVLGHIKKVCEKEYKRECEYPD